MRTSRTDYLHFPEALTSLHPHSQKSAQDWGTCPFLASNRLVVSQISFPENSHHHIWDSTWHSTND